MKKLKLFLVFTIVLTAMVLLFAFSVSAEDTIYSGTWGDLTWELNAITGELVISGEGGMNSFSDTSTSAWRNYRSSIKSVTLGEGVTSIGSYAFYNCSNLASITIPNGVTSILGDAFYECSNLTSITIPDSITSIGTDAFWGCSSLETITFGENSKLKSIGGYAFRYCSSLTTINIPNGVTSIGFYAFYGCSSLTSINIPNGVTSINTYVFFSCSNLETVTFGKNSTLTTIHSYAFTGCSSLMSITIPNSVTSIQNSAFSLCSSLASITIPNSVTSIGEYAFRGCSGLESIAVKGGNTKYHSDGNCLIYTATKRLLVGCKNSIIPADGSVTSIGDYAFYDCNSLTSITIPDSITSIGDGAFEGCNNLANITVPFVGASLSGTDNKHFGYIFGASSSFYNDDDVPISLKTVVVTGGSSIGDSAFYGCSRLTAITIPDSVTSIGSYAFSGCSNITSITIPESVTSIGSGAFSRCISLESLSVEVGNTKYHSVDNCLIDTANKTLVLGCKSSVIPTNGSVISISSDAFYNCSSLTSITIPDSITSIDDRAFYGCSNLTSITIPKSVTSIGTQAFYGCRKLIEVFNFSSLALTVGESSYGYIAYYAKHIYSSDRQPSNLKIQNDYIFYVNGDTRYLMGYAGSNSTLILPKDCDGYTYSIYPYAFYDCINLTSITIPTSVTSIGTQAFYDCSNLTGVHITDLAAWCNIQFADATANPLFYGKKLYLNDNLITALKIPSGVTAIKDYAFLNCSSLTSITIPEDITSIAQSAFSGCSNLKSITLPFVGASLNGTSNTHFGYIFGANSYSSNNKYVPASLKTVVITGGISIGYDAFRDCQNLTSITLPGGITYIGNRAFEDCSSLKTVTFGENSKLTSIGTDAFRRCKNLTLITIPEGVTSIGHSAFLDCINLTSITIPASVTSIESDAFGRCNSLAGIYITDLAAWCKVSLFNSSANPLYYAKKLYLNGSPIFALEIPNGVTSIGSYAFSGCSSITSITIPESVTSIGSSAFSGCSSITSITIPESVTSIDWGAFQNCSSITSITIPTSVTSIGSYAFSGCSSISSITIPTSVTSIGGYAFSGCNNLESMTLPFVGGSAKTASQTYQYPFGYIFGTSSYTGAVATEQYYYGSSTSSTTNSIYYIPESLKSVTITGGNILYGAFYSCSSITSITIPTSLTSIGGSAFRGCGSLVSITIPASVESIGASAFEYCTTLKSVYINSNSLLAKFDDFTALGYLLMYCDTVAVPTGAIVAELIMSTFPNTENITYQNNTYTAYSVHEHTWEDATTYVKCEQSGFSGSACAVCSLMNGTYLDAQHTYGKWQKHNAAQHKRECACDDVEYADHNWNDGVITTPATHLDLGVKTFTCSDCGETKTEDVPKTTAHEYGEWQKHNATQHKRVCACTDVEYADHNWNSGVITTPATHLELGVKTYTCTDCSETKTEDVAKLTEHTYDAWQKHTATQHKRECACEDIEYADHNWNNGVITTPATHLELGTKTYTCTDCSETKTEDVPKTTAHEYGEWQKHNATQHKRVCACTDVEYADHNWNSGLITTPATHLELGVKTYTCTDCGEIKTEDVAKLTEHTYDAWQKHDAEQHKRVCVCTDIEYADHNWNSGVITTPATHLELGVKTYTCTDCGETKTEDVPKTTAHEYGEWQKHNAAQHKRECACEDIEYADHDWNDGVITTPTTHLEIGTKTYTCSDCGETKTEDMPKTTAHEYGEWTTIKEATTSEAGLREKGCACGDKVSEEIPKLTTSASNTDLNSNQSGEPNDTTEDGFSTGAVIGIVSGGVVAVGGGGFALWWFVFRKKKLI